MRTHGLRLFAIVSMLALLFGGQVCMLVQCSPKHAPAAAHPCCTAGAPASAAKHVPVAPASHESARPCCIQATMASVPSLEPPAAFDCLHAPAATLVAVQVVAAPRAALVPSPPGDAESPLPTPPLSAAGSRAPPLA